MVILGCVMCGGYGRSMFRVEFYAIEAGMEEIINNTSFDDSRLTRGFMNCT